MFSVPGSERSGKVNNSALDDAIEAIRSGDKNGMLLLYSECAQAVYAYALSVLKKPHDAEDVLHDCFLQIWEHADSYSSRGKPMAWILTITRNLCYSRLRGQERIEELPEDLALPVTVEPEQRIVLEACLRKLDDGERQIVVLHAVGGLRHREIASLMKLPLGTVLSKYSRAIGKLREMLVKEGIR